MAQQDPKLQSMQYKTVVFAPKLRKNRKIELRWGNKYYEAVKTAVFSTQFTPYMPAEPPQSIREEIDKTGYVCKQCRDCFRFLSSIEEHTSRRSWVLGFWCQQCFVTTCTHKTQGKSNCSNCIDVETAKHDYLLSKGIKRNLKKGVTRIFYNQCQFFAHLRMHGINIVDLGELMLMPLPCGIEQEHYAQLDKIWKALIEAMFIRRIHIMDWIRDKKICWKDVLNSHPKKADLVADIVKAYAEDCIGPLDKSESSRQDNPIQFEDSRRIARNIVSRGTSAQLKQNSGDGRRNNIHIISSKTHKTADKFVSNDIAFVDCGPTPNNCISESPNLNSPDRNVESPEKGSNAIEKESPLVDKKFDHEPPLWPSFSRKYEKLREQSRSESQKNQKTPEDRSESSSLPSISRTGPRVLTIRSPRSLSLSTIMKHLPSDAPNRKKLVVVKEDGKTGNGFSGPAESPGIKKDRSETKKTTVVETKTSTPVASKNDVKTKPSTKTNSNASAKILINYKDNPTLAANAVSQTFSEQMSLHGKIVFQNGRKYIIRHVPKEKYSSVSQDWLAAKKFHNPPPLSMPVSVSKRLLLPKPQNVPVKISFPLRKSIVVKQPPQVPKILQKLTNAAGLSFVPLTAKCISQNNKPKITKMHKSIIARIRESMHNELQKATKKELEVYIKNLKEINEMYIKTIGLEGNSAVFSNCNSIERFEKLAVSAPAGDTIKEEPDALIEDPLEKNAKDWESNMKNWENHDCSTCRKKLKPSTYIIGLSEPASDESIYCQCYNSICYICNTNQGSLIQLIAHIKWHKGKKPFSCPDCSLGFKSARDLEIHSWTTCFHPMSRHIYGCSVCEIEGILDMEMVAKHFLLLHTRRKVICSECKMEYSGNSLSEADYKQHNATHHQDIPFISAPKRLFLCTLKQCVVRPELFRTHLSDHIGVLSWVYYKCPFCTMATQGTIRNKAMIREHLVENHLNRLHEVVSAESLPDVLHGIQFPPSSSAAAAQTAIDNLKKVSQVTNANTSGPMIINARSITPASFHCGSDISQDQIEDSTLPKILDVRSEATDEFETSDFTVNDYNMQIIAVESLTGKRAESPETKSENSDAISQESVSDELASLGDENGTMLESYTSPVKNDIDDETFHSNDNINSELNCPPPKLERKPSSSFDMNDDSQEWNVCEKYKDEFLTISESDKNARRPWRIALNSPSSVEASPVAYNCHVCGELINTSWSVIKNHFSTRHASDYELSVVSPQIPQISSGYIGGGYRDDCHIRKRKSEGSITPGGKRRRRWGPKKYFEKPGSPSLGICVRPEPVQEIEGSFRCKKCDEPFDEISMMREHIATKHRIKGQYLICLECGENFVVVPSLQMHLKALHGIEDPITYLTQNTAYAPDTPEDTDEEERTAESNQCYVCMAVFEDKAAVDKHIRVHGMAFLKRKRFEAQKAQKCGIMKAEPPDNIKISVSPEKLKEEEEASKVSMETNETLENAGNSDDKTTSVQKPLKFWVKKFDFIDSFNTNKSIEDKTHDVSACTLETEKNDVSLSGATDPSITL